jgi:hypothetical protein
MNYQSIYNNLIIQAQRRALDPTVLYEKHHIIPKSLGGSNKPSNLVKLTLREHFVAHRLLVKIHASNSHNSAKMVHALWWMCKTKSAQDDSIVSSHAYETARSAFILHCPMKDAERKKRVAEKRAQGLYRYDNAKLSIIHKARLAELTEEQMQDRMSKSTGSADHTKRGESIRKGKASKFKIIQHDGSTIEFWSYDNVKEITGVSYQVILLRLRLHKGLLTDGRQIACVSKFNKSNHKKPRSKLLLEKANGTSIVFDPSEDVKALTGYSLCTIRNRILRRGGLLSDGSRVSYLQKYNGKEK